MHRAFALDTLEDLFETQDDRHEWTDPTVDLDEEDLAPPEAPWWEEYVDYDHEVRWSA